MWSGLGYQERRVTVINYFPKSLKVTTYWPSFLQELMQPKYSSGFYIEQLRTHKDIALNKNSGASNKKMLKGLEPVEMILRSLEVDLRTHPNTT